MGILDDLTAANCGSCQWWHQSVHTTGECHHRSPSGYFCPDADAIALAVWPTTAPVDTCGDWERRHEAA